MFKVRADKVRAKLSAIPDQARNRFIVIVRDGGDIDFRAHNIRNSISLTIATIAPHDLFVELKGEKSPRGPIYLTKVPN